jgi:ParB family transcriptional regulator, chromosome partitioning protein
MNRKRGLGSGLDALIPGAATDPAQAVRMIKADSVRENRSQPRTQFDDRSLDELAASIREHGLIQPIIVNEEIDGGYELIAGERRLRAAKRAGLTEIPALIKSATPQQLLELAIVENVQRADLNPLEEGLAYQTLKDDFALTDDAIAQRVGKSRVAIVNMRRLIRLGAEARKALLDRTISAGHGRVLLRFEAEDEQLLLLQLLVQRDLSVREAERLADVALHEQLAPSARLALLRGAIQTTQAQSLLRIEERAQQTAVLEGVLTYSLGVRETEQVCSLIIEGTAPADAFQAVRERYARDRSPGVGAPPSTPPAPNLGVEQRSGRTLTPEDAEAQRMFEQLLATPVQLLRNGREIRLMITMYDDDQLQGLYDRLARD